MPEFLDDRKLFIYHKDIFHVSPLEIKNSN